MTKMIIGMTTRNIGNLRGCHDLSDRGEGMTKLNTAIAYIVLAVLIVSLFVGVVAFMAIIMLVG